LRLYLWYKCTKMHHFNTKTPQITVCCKTSYDIVFILLPVQGRGEGEREGRGRGGKERAETPLRKNWLRAWGEKGHPTFADRLPPVFNRIDFRTYSNDGIVLVNRNANIERSSQVCSGVRPQWNPVVSPRNPKQRCVVEQLIAKPSRLRRLHVNVIQLRPVRVRVVP